MLYLRGQKAIPHFRIERLLTEISFEVPKVYGINAEYIYFIDIPENLTESQNELLYSLLQYDAKANHKKLKESQKEENLILIIPAFGTISSWSNKATDIAHYCGLKEVKRIERGVAYYFQSTDKLTWGDIQSISTHLFDPITETVVYHFQEAEALFQNKPKSPLQWVDVIQEGYHALAKANKELQLQLKKEELLYLWQHYVDLKRNPTDVELMIFAKICHYEADQKYFKSQWVIDEDFKPQSLISMMKNTVQVNPRGISLNSENSPPLIFDHRSAVFFPENNTKHYQFNTESLHLAIGALSHMPEILNIPYQGAALALGRETRQEGSADRGAKPKAGFTGFYVKDDHIEGVENSFLNDFSEFTTDIPLNMINIGLGAAQFANEFGRPNLGGYFRSFSQKMNHENKPEYYSYETPLMITGGISEVRDCNQREQKLEPETLLLILGAKASLTGLGLKQENLNKKLNLDKNLSFVPLEKMDAELQRRAQAVINHCIAMGEKNPILAIQNVTKGGLAKIIPEFLWQRNLGGYFELAKIPVINDHLSPLEIWCNETEERYLLAIHKENLEILQKMALIENCPMAVIGKIIEEPELRCFDEENHNFPIDIPLSLLFDLPSKRQTAKSVIFEHSPFDHQELEIKDSLYRLLKMPTIGDKSFLITLCDRTVTGLVSRDQMVGPWQVPVADCAVTACSFIDYHGEAFALGERSPLMLLDAKASARMSIGEAITNIAAACIGTISDIRCAVNSFSTHDSFDGYQLYSAIKALALEFCPLMNIAVPILQGSLISPENTPQMLEKKLNSPLSLVVSAFAPVMDIRRTLTPVLSLQGETDLIFIDLAFGRMRLGGSAFYYLYNALGHECPDVEEPAKLKDFFNIIQRLNLEGKILSYHDRSDGGLFITLCEMAFASHTGLYLDLTALGEDEKAILFNEELGAVIQVKSDELEGILLELYDQGLTHCYNIGKINTNDQITILFKEEVIFSEDRVILNQLWSQNSYHLQAIRDNPRSAKKLFDTINDRDDPGLNVELTFDIKSKNDFPAIHTQKPKVAILREQGSQGEFEMAAAFVAAGFEAVDVHMNELAESLDLSQFMGLAVCGGFTFGDVLEAGFGFAMRILSQPKLKDLFQSFFERSNTFTLGVGNGCQMLAHLKSIIPGAKLWPKFIRNTSLQFESRLCLVEVEPSPSILFEGMEGSRLLIPVAHAEGLAEFTDEDTQQKALQQHLITLRFVDNRGRKTKVYPANPNGSPLGITGLTNEDGRVCIMMPHPERAFRTVQYSYHPKNWGEEAPWLRLFQNARTWLG